MSQGFTKNVLLDTDPTLAGNSDYIAPTQQAVKTYVDNQTHDASDITSGTMATARLGSGSASSSVFLRGDQTWAKVGTWTSYALTWSSTGVAPAIGNGTTAAYYTRIGDVCFAKIAINWGSTTTGGTGAWLFSLPITAVEGSGTYAEPAGAILSDATVGQYIAQSIRYTSTTFYLQTDAAPNGVGQGTDFTWTTNDRLTALVIYEVA